MSIRQVLSHQLSRSIYRSIERYKYPIDGLIYNRTRAKKYSESLVSYDGRGFPHHVLGVTLKELEDELGKYPLLPLRSSPSIKMFTRYPFVFNGRICPVDWHSHFTINDKLIIDPLYRNLLFDCGSGTSDKLVSPYADYLFEKLPPVFVGTSRELQRLVKDVLIEKSKDPLHSQDNIGDPMT